MHQSPLSTSSSIPVHINISKILVNNCPSLLCFLVSHLSSLSSGDFLQVSASDVATHAHHTDQQVQTGDDNIEPAPWAHGQVRLSGLQQVPRIAVHWISSDFS